MPSVWQYFCCFCDNDDDKRQFSPRFKHSNIRQNKRRTKADKNTWARRNLLDNEHIELDEIRGERVACEMRAIPTSTNNHELAGDNRRILEQFVPKKRPTLYDVFEKHVDEKSSSKTTFPWMDEGFVPQARNGTRLGISSVQMNAKRNETAMQRNKDTQNPNMGKGRPNALTPYIKSKSFTEGQGTKVVGSHPPDLNSKFVQVNSRNMQNGHVLQNNRTTAPNAFTSVNRPVRLGVPNNFIEKPMILKAPTSDVSVRKIVSTQAKLHQDRIPKLVDYTGVSGVKHATHDNANIGNFRPSVMDIFANTELTNNETEDVADVSYSSEVIFRKPPSEHSGSDVSLKRSAAPGMFSSRTSKYERLKPGRSKSQISEPEKTRSKPKFSNLSSSESMYGYVPKAVQNVYASNALEGTKLDDFFMQKMHERQLDNFGSLINETNSDDEPIIITTVVESIEDLTVAGKTGVDKVAETKSTRKIIPLGKEGPERVSESSKTDSKDKAINKLNNITESTNTYSVLNTNTLPKETIIEQVTSIDEDDDKLIMIDFPPNLGNDKIRTLNNLKQPSKSEETNKSTTLV